MHGPARPPPASAPEYTALCHIVIVSLFIFVLIKIFRTSITSKCACYKLQDSIDYVLLNYHNYKVAFSSILVHYFWIVLNILIPTRVEKIKERLYPHSLKITPDEN